MPNATSPRPKTPRVHRAAGEEERRRQMIEATIEAIAELGFSATTIAEIARRAEVSTGLVAFYFRDKDGLLEATLRHLSSDLARAVVSRLRAAGSPRERIQAVIDANLGASQFHRRIATVWLAFWGQVPHNAHFRRVQRIYERRMISDLVDALKAYMAPADARHLAHATAALIDGLWLRGTLAGEEPATSRAREIVTAFVDTQLLLLDLALLRRPAQEPAHAIPRTHS